MAYTKTSCSGTRGKPAEKPHPIWILLVHAELATVLRLCGPSKLLVMMTTQITYRLEIGVKGDGRLRTLHALQGSGRSRLIVGPVERRRQSSVTSSSDLLMIQLLARASYAFSQCWHTVYEEVHAIRFSSFCVTGTSSDACTSIAGQQ